MCNISCDCNHYITSIFHKELTTSQSVLAVIQSNSTASYLLFASKYPLAHVVVSITPKCIFCQLFCATFHNQAHFQAILTVCQRLAVAGKVTVTSQALFVIYQLSTLAVCDVPVTSFRVIQPPHQPQGIVTVRVQALSEAVTQAPTKSIIVTPQDVQAFVHSSLNCISGCFAFNNQSTSVSV